jgi:hypothetical protein
MSRRNGKIIASPSIFKRYAYIEEIARLDWSISSHLFSNDTLGRGVNGGAAA